VRGFDVLDLERLDLSVRWTSPQRQLDPIDGLVVSLDHRFDAAVGQIACVAMDSLGCRTCGREHPKSDTLHAPADKHPSRDDHETLIIPAHGTVRRMHRIGSSSHGESRLRMLRVTRRGDRHDPKELSVSFRFEGPFADAFREGKADGLPPGETLKNLVHRAALEHGSCEIEEFGLAMCDRVLKQHPAITLAKVEITEQAWTRLDAGGRPQGQAFVAGSAEVKTAAVTSNGRQVAVVSGLDALNVMRTAGFTPASVGADDGVNDGVQRLLVGQLSAKWTYSSADVTFRPYRQGVRAAIIETFAWHPSRSVHHTLYAIAEVVLATYQEIADVTLAFHERPYRPADLFRAGLENPDDLFVAVEEPLGIVEVKIERESR
jgi:urate oxidase